MSDDKIEVDAKLLEEAYGVMLEAVPEDADPGDVLYTLGAVVATCAYGMAGFDKALAQSVIEDLAKIAGELVEKQRERPPRGSTVQ